MRSSGPNALILPAVLPLLVFTVLPVLGAIGLSFTYFDAFSATMRSAGTANYNEAFGNELFRITIRNTVQFTLGFVSTFHGGWIHGRNFAESQNSRHLLPARRLLPAGPDLDYRDGHRLDVALSAAGGAGQPWRSR